MCISCASSEEFEMDAGGHLEAVGLISEEIATGHGCSLLQRRPSCCICCQIVKDIWEWYLSPHRLLEHQLNYPQRFNPQKQVWVGPSMSVFIYTRWRLKTDDSALEREDFRNALAWWNWFATSSLMFYLSSGNNRLKVIIGFPQS